MPSEETRDPFVVLGVSADASLADLRDARRRLAMELHPDRGGDERRMREVNQAYDEAAARLVRGSAAPTAPTVRQTAPHDARRSGRRVAHDSPSFVIELLPVEAFEALLVVASWMGEVLVDDPPYVLETHLDEPWSCWCRLDLVPDAGSTTVSLTIAGPDDGARAGAVLPDVDDVRDAWVAQLNQLGRWDPTG